MTNTNDQIFVNAYNAMKHHLANQVGSRTRGLFVEEMAKGEKHFFDRIGAFSVSAIESLYAPLTPQDSAMSRRMCTVASFENSVVIGDIEKVKMLVDPTNDIVMEVMAAHDRNYDDVVFAALLGSAATGKDGTGSAATFDSNNQIAHGSAGLTLAKMLQAQRILEANDVDLDADDVYIFLPPRGKEYLLAITNFTSRDFQYELTLGGKSLPAFRGMKIISTNRVPAQTAGSVYRAIVCTSRALRVAKGIEDKVDISQRKDLSNLPFQVYAQSSIGAVRMEEKLVVDVLFQ